MSDEWIEKFKKEKEKYDAFDKANYIYCYKIDNKIKDLLLKKNAIIKQKAKDNLIVEIEGKIWYAFIITEAKIRNYIPRRAIIDTRISDDRARDIYYSLGHLSLSSIELF